MEGNDSEAVEHASHEASHRNRIQSIYFLLLLQFALLLVTVGLLLYVAKLRSDLARASTLRCHAIVTALEVTRADALSGIRVVRSGGLEDTPPKLAATIRLNRTATVVENRQRWETARRTTIEIHNLLNSPFCVKYQGGKRP